MTSKVAPIAEKIDVCLRQLAACRTISDRVTVMQKHDHPMLRKVLTYAHSPYIKFGVKVDRTSSYELLSLTHNRAGLDIDDDEIWHTLDTFRKSTASSASKIAMLKPLFGRLNVQTAQIVLGILEKCSVKNISESTINKAWPNTIPVFSVQLAQKYADRKIKSYPQYVEIKYDGVRATAVIHPSGDVEVLTRTGRAIPAASYFHDELRRIGDAYATVVDEPAGRVYDGCVTDGELCGDTFNDAVSIFRSDAPATSGSYALFDILPMESLTNKDFESLPFEKRREILELVMAEANKRASMSRVLRSVSYAANSKEEIWRLYNSARTSKLEGVIVKDPKGKWERKRSNAWLKIKAEDTGDFKVIGAFEGEGEMEGTLGGLIVEGKQDDGTRIESRVGSGFTHADRDTIWAMFLRDLEKHEAGVTDIEEFELIGNIVEVQYQEITADNSLRHPVFIRLRKDKDEVNF